MVRLFALCLLVSSLASAVDQSLGVTCPKNNPYPTTSIGQGWCRVSDFVATGPAVKRDGMCIYTCKGTKAVFSPSSGLGCEAQGSLYGASCVAASETFTYQTPLDAEEPNPAKQCNTQNTLPDCSVKNRQGYVVSSNAYRGACCGPKLDTTKACKEKFCYASSLYYNAPSQDWTAKCNGAADTQTVRGTCLEVCNQLGPKCNFDGAYIVLDPPEIADPTPTPMPTTTPTPAPTPGPSTSPGPTGTGTTTTSTTDAQMTTTYGPNPSGAPRP